MAGIVLQQPWKAAKVAVLEAIPNPRPWGLSMIRGILFLVTLAVATAAAPAPALAKRIALVIGNALSDEKIARRKLMPRIEQPVRHLAGRIVVPHHIADAVVVEVADCGDAQACRV
jgi:hypothetical protein